MTVSPSSAARTQVAQRAQDNGQQPKTLVQLVTSMQTSGEWNRALPANIITPERFTRVALTALRKNPDLQKCNPESVMGALVTAAQLGLEPNTPLGQCSLVKYGNECTLQIEYRGYVALARRSGQIESVVARTVFAHDDFELEYGLDEKLVHRPAKGEAGDPVGYYAVAKYMGGGHNFLYMTRDAVDKHRKKFSKQPNGPAWANSFDSMAQKTVLRALFKFMPLSVELARADAVDETPRRSADLDAIDEQPEVLYAEAIDDEPGVDTATGEVQSEPDGGWPEVPEPGSKAKP